MIRKGKKKDYNLYIGIKPTNVREKSLLYETISKIYNNILTYLKKNLFWNQLSFDFFKVLILWSKELVMKYWGSN